MAKKLLVIADCHVHLEQWRKASGIKRGQVRRVLGWQHVAGEVPRTAALMFLGYSVPDSADSYVKRLIRDGARIFRIDETEAAIAWLGEP